MKTKHKLSGYAIKGDADSFPRVMWVWDGEPEDCERVNIVEHNLRKWLPWIGENFTQDTSDAYLYASDTHPVTREPAVK